MKYLLDTCVISDFIKNESNTAEQIKNTSPTEIAVSTITVMEIQYGLALYPKRAEVIRPIIHDFLNAVYLLPFSEEDANQAAILRALLKQQGTPIGSYDILLAGAALCRQLIFVTSNTKEFNRIDGLKIENWR
jgi:tRNA(fMet)-specific endonuclease VapC